MPVGYIFTELTYGYTTKLKTESHMNNWQHVTISLPLILSGITEVRSLVEELGKTIAQREKEREREIDRE